MTNPNHRKFLAGLSSALVWSALLLLSGVAFAAEPEVLWQGTWTQKNYAIDGGWRIVQEGETRTVVLTDDFSTRRAPDLKIFLSPLPLEDLNNRNATAASVLVATLEKHKGAQRYAIPAGIDLNDFKTLLIHCEQYSKLWGGASLAR